MLRGARLPHRHQRCHRRVRHNPIGAAPWRCPPLVPHLDRRRRHLRRPRKWPKVEVKGGGLRGCVWRFRRQRNWVEPAPSRSPSGKDGRCTCSLAWVECPLVLPQFEQDQLAGIGDALEYLELFAAGILPRDLAARLHRLSELGALAGPRVERHDEPNRYGRSFRARIWTNQFHDPPAAASSAPGMQLADRGDQRDGRVQERIPRVIDLHGTGGFTAIGIALVHRIWY